MRFISIILLITFLSACASSGNSSQSTSASNSDGNIWFYRTNSKGQQIGFTLVKDTNVPGCHNLLKTSRLHRIAVKGFQYCEVFAEKDCQEGTKLSAQWLAKRVKSDDKKQPTTKFSKGSRWVFDREGNIMARSWRCVE